MSPFDDGKSPAQFVFLVGAATTGLTLIVIFNRLREMRARLRAQLRQHLKGSKGNKKAPAGTKIFIKNLRSYLRWGNLLALSQLVLMNFILFRIVWSALAKVPLWFDVPLLIYGFLTMGAGWFVYFLWLTKRELLPGATKNLIDPFK
jgi:hypothetical protein